MQTQENDPARDIRINIDGDIVFEVDNVRRLTWQSILVLAILEIVASLTILCVCWDSNSVLPRLWIIAYTGRHVIRLPYSYSFWVEGNQETHVLQVLSRLNFWQLALAISGKNFTSDNPLARYVRLQSGFYIFVMFIAPMSCLFLAIILRNVMPDFVQRILRQVQIHPRYRGVSNEDLDNLEEYQFIDSEDTGSTSEENETNMGKQRSCSICLSGFKQSEQIRVLPCRHEFVTDQQRFYDHVRIV